MADIIIKKRISLEFNGAEYKDSYLVFKCMGVGEYDWFIDNTPDDRKAEIKFLANVLKDRFIEGRFLEQDVEAKDISKFDEGTLSRCLQLITGQEIDPK